MNYRLLLGFVLLMFSISLLSRNIDRRKDVQDKIVATFSAKTLNVPLYGFNGNNVRGPSFINKDLLDTIATTNLKIIRYPGGTVGDWWDWEKGWFVDANLPRTFSRIKQIPNGLRELKLLVDKTGCEVVFTLNMISKDLDNQIRMLKYAQTMGIEVKWIELGNEYNNQKSEGIKKFQTAENYSRNCSLWINEIKKHFPNAKLSIVGGNRKYNANVGNWNEIVLSNVPKADAIVAHLYPWASRIVDANMVIDFDKVQKEFTQDFDRQGFDKISKPIWITEYNILWSQNIKDPSKEKSIKSNKFTWGNALASILMTSLCSSLPGTVNMVLNHNLTGSPAYAAINARSSSLQKLPNGIGMTAWLTAAKGMTKMKKLNFYDDSRIMADSKLLGWVFTNENTGKASAVLTNFTSENLQLDVSKLVFAQQAKVQIQFADKSKIVTTWNDINRTYGNLTSNTLSLPPYSIAMISD